MEFQYILGRVLTAEEFRRMVDISPDYLKPILRCASYRSERKTETLGLTWERVDLRAGFIRRREDDSKTGDRRSIPVGCELRDELNGLPLALNS